MTKLETNGVRDMIFQDKEYMKSKITVDQTTDPDGYKKQLDQFKKDPTQLIADYKNYAMSDETGLKYTYDNAKGPDPIRSGGGGDGKDFFDGFYGGRGASGSWESSGAKSSMRQNIDNRKTFGDYDGVFGKYIYNKNNDTYTLDGTEMSPWEVIKNEKLTRQGETSTSFTTAANAGSEDDDNVYKVTGDDLLGDDTDVVKRFKNNKILKQAGFKFSREPEIGTRAINIYGPGFAPGDSKGGIKIDLNDPNAVNKIMKFFNNKKPKI